MYGQSILHIAGLRDLLLGQVAIDKGLLSAPEVAEICLRHVTRGATNSSVVMEELAAAGNLTAERVQEIEDEADRRIRVAARVHSGTDRRAAPRDGSSDLPPSEALRPMVEGRYADFALVACGGRGLIYSCQDRELRRRVAMKLRKPQVDGDLSDPLSFVPPQGGPELVAFEREREELIEEARKQGRVGHPGVVPVLELGQTPRGVPFFTMTCGTGLTLGDALARPGRVDIDALDVLRQVAETVSHVHESTHCVHLDLNPGNVMLGSVGEAYVMDFGAASLPGKWTSPEGFRAAGTPGWTAPELQSDRCRIHPSQDIYALGAVLYHVLTGDRPFPGQSLIAPFRSPGVPRLLPPSHMIPAAEERLSSLCMQCLAVKPKERPQSAREVAERLRIALAGRRTR